MYDSCGRDKKFFFFSLGNKLQLCEGVSKLTSFLWLSACKDYGS